MIQRKSFSDLTSEQQEDVNWLLEPLPCGSHHKYLANAMGTGKTPVAAHAASRAGRTGLIICPASIKDGFEDEATAWKQQLQRWGGFVNIQVITSGADYPSGEVIVVNYEMLVRSEPLQRALMKKTFDWCIIDEAHRLKGLNSKITDLVLYGGRKALISRAKYKWLLSGSAMPNRPIELFPPIRALCPELIEPYLTRDDFARYFCDGYFDGRSMSTTGASHVEELAERLAPFFRRREHAQDALPDCIYHDVFVDIGKVDIDESVSPMATVRKYLGDAKLPHCVDFLEQLFTLDGDKRTPDKIVVFTYSRSVTEGLVAALQDRHAVAYYGGLTAKEKAENLHRFKTDYRCRVLVAQMQAAGEGIDGLQHVCSDIVYAEQEWCDEYIAQQVARVLRRGQLNEVNVYHLIAQGTLDDKMIRAQKTKAKTVEKFWLELREPQGEVTHNNEDKTMLEDILKELVAAVDRNTEALKSLSLGASAPAENGQQEAPKKGGRPAKKTDAAPESAPPVASQESLAPVTLDEVIQCAIDALAAITGGSDDESVCAPARARLRAALDPVIGADCPLQKTPADKCAAAKAAILAVDTTPIKAKVGLGI